MLIRRRPGVFLRGRYAWLYVRAGCVVLMVSPAGERGQVSEAVETGKKKVCPAGEGGEGRQPFENLANRTLGDLVFQCAVLCSADRIALVSQFVKVAVVDPHVLCELELAHQAGADDERGDAPVGAVVVRALGKRLAVRRAATDHSAPVHVYRSVAWV